MKVVAALTLLGLSLATADQKIDKNIERILTGGEKERDLQYYGGGFDDYYGADDDDCCLEWELECYGGGKSGMMSKGSGSYRSYRDRQLMGSKSKGGNCEWVCVEYCEDPPILPPRPPMCWPTQSYTDPRGCDCDCQCCEVGAIGIGKGGIGYPTPYGYGGFGFGKGGRWLEENEEQAQSPAPEAEQDERKLGFGSPFVCDCDCKCRRRRRHYSGGKSGMMMGSKGKKGGYYYGGYGDDYMDDWY